MVLLSAERLSPDMVTVRPVAADDLAPARAVYEAAVRGSGPEVYDAGQVDAWLAHWGGSRLPGVGLVAEVDGDVVGLAEADLRVGTVEKVYVHPRHAREGVGRALLSGLERHAAARGLGGLSLRSSLNAVGFYERAGYREMGAVTQAYDGVALRCVEMRKALSGSDRTAPS